MIEAEHSCMAMRGVKQHGASTVTTQFTGVFRDNAAEQTRFLDLLRGEQPDVRKCRRRFDDLEEGRGLLAALFGRWADHLRHGRRRRRRRADGRAYECRSA